MNKKKWIIGYLVIVLIPLISIACMVIKIDPFFHYHKPYTDQYAYRLNNERSQNDGIIKHFDYTGLITGSSMTENFRTSEAESLWGGTFIKVSFSGGTYKEINDHVQTAVSRNKDLKIVIRGLDATLFGSRKDALRYRRSNYPFYLYDQNPFNDVKYLFNKEVVLDRVFGMLYNLKIGKRKPGINSFDSYANWMSSFSFGKNSVYPEGIPEQNRKAPEELSERDIETIRSNIRQNVTAVADENPNVTFYYFFPPYSAGYWLDKLNNGQFQRQMQSERIVIEELLRHENIKLFSFNCCFDITTDLNHYKDLYHHGEWINSLILRWMYDDRYLLTQDNYEQYLDLEYEFYLNYDYSELMNSVDYENDYYAAALLNQKITGAIPYHIDLSDTDSYQLSHAVVTENQYNGLGGVICTGTLHRLPEQPLGDYLLNVDYAGIRISIKDIFPYKYLAFYGRKIKGNGHPTIEMVDAEGAEAAAYSNKSGDLDDQWQEYVIKISGDKGSSVLVLNGGDTLAAGDADSQFVFSDITLY